MGESHSMMLVKQTIEDVQRHLDAEARGEIPTVSTFLEGQTVSLAHTLNRALRHMNLRVTRATTYDKAMRKDYVPAYKRVALGTMLQLQADPTEFDAVYDALSDEDSRRTFDWFISYRTALAFLGGNEADDVVPGTMNPAEWQRVGDQAGRMFVGGAYHIDGMTVETLLAELVLTFFLEQYRLKDIVEPSSGLLVPTSVTVRALALGANLVPGTRGRRQP